MSYEFKPARAARLMATLRMSVGISALLVALMPAGLSAAPIPDEDCLMCHDDPELTKETETGDAGMSLYVDAEQLRRSVHAELSCADCHSNVGPLHPDEGPIPAPVDCESCHVEHSAEADPGIHARLESEGTPGVASCTDCHGKHDVFSPTDLGSPLHASRVMETCGQCHEQVTAEVQESVHGQGLARGKRDVPTCIDCHAEHRDEELPFRSPNQFVEWSCNRCHASLRINSQYHLPADRVETFLGSYHGLATQFGSTRAANCASCHGVHLILPSSDSRSSIHPDNLVATCGQCHPGANEKFALSQVHVDFDHPNGDFPSKVNWWVRLIYQYLIFGVCGLFILHNGLIWWQKAKKARAAYPRKTLLMTRKQRVQHALLVVSFVVLAVTGFALRFPESWLGRILGHDESIRRWIHRVAAVAFVILGVYHVGYALFTREGRRTLGELWPRWADLGPLKANLRFACGRSSGPAAHGPTEHRFNYIEKIEYWAVVWGAIIMGVTGFMIWFPVEVTRFLPRWAVDVATTIHYFEAILACLSILVWHFYHVIFDPDVYPLNWAFWDGYGPEAPSAKAKASPPKNQ